MRAAYAWVERAAAILSNERGESAPAVRRRFGGLLGAITRAAARGRTPHRAALRHFAKVTRSYWPGLFACYGVADVPRTNNEIEHRFGAHRYHERRASGRRGAAPSLVVRGSVRLLAGTATRVRPVSGDEIAPTDLAAWQRLRRTLDQRAHVRTLGRRFRHSADAYLRGIEDTLVRATLPA